MATKTPTDETLSNTDFPLWDALAAIDRKDYDWWSNLTPEQQRKWSPYMMVLWTSAVRAGADLAGYYVRSVDHYANTHMFNECVVNHPQLQWYMLCAASPGCGVHRHLWTGSLSTRITRYSERAKLKDVQTALDRTHPHLGSSVRADMAQKYCNMQHLRVYLAAECKEQSLEDIATLASVLTDEEIREYKRQCGDTPQL